MDAFSTLMVLIFFVESFWEVRLYSRLTREEPALRGDSKDRVQHVLRLERRWNMFSWVIVFAVLILPEHLFMPLSCMLVLFETIVIMRLDQEERRLNN